jgi:hypothetical protein
MWLPMTFGKTTFAGAVAASERRPAQTISRAASFRLMEFK